MRNSFLNNQDLIHQDLLFLRYTHLWIHVYKHYFLIGVSFKGIELSTTWKTHLFAYNYLHKPFYLHRFLLIQYLKALLNRIYYSLVWIRKKFTWKTKILFQNQYTWIHFYLQYLHKWNKPQLCTEARTNDWLIETSYFSIKWIFACNYHLSRTNNIVSPARTLLSRSLLVISYLALVLSLLTQFFHSLSQFFGIYTEISDTNRIVPNLYV